MLEAPIYPVKNLFSLILLPKRPKVGSSFSALRQPADAAVDVLDATLAAGVALSDADANARGELCVIQCLAATMVGCRDVTFPMACRVLLPPVLRIWAQDEETSL